MSPTSADQSSSESQSMVISEVKVVPSGPLSNSILRKTLRKADQVINGVQMSQLRLHYELEKSTARVASHPQLRSGTVHDATEEGLARARAEITVLQGIIFRHVRELQTFFDRNDGYGVPEHE